jgi:predicted dehydrogenase
MPESTTRRDFVKSVVSATAGAGLLAGLPTPGAASVLSTRSPTDTVTVAIVGTGGRGTSLAASFARLQGTRVTHVCDVDRGRRQEAARRVDEAQGIGPRIEGDLRRVLEDPNLDAVVIATPNHWHTPATILALKAGKHVYVEKPGSHNCREAELLVEATGRYGRVVQMGNQRRSWPGVIEGIERVRDGVVGSVHHSRGWYANARGSIGRGRLVPPPADLDYELWQGPAPRTPFRDNILHYNWHWFWRWGGGEAANNGVHALDLCRWGLGVDHPVRVTSTGGRYFWADDQETPDTQVITFEFQGGRSVVWEGLSCNRRGIEGTGFGASFHGSDGTVVIEGYGYRIFDHAGRLVEHVEGVEEAGDPAARARFDIDRDHIANFASAIRTGEALRSPIDDAQKSTLLCHLGNIAQRTGRALKIEPERGRILDDAEAARLWGREYAPGWEPAIG